MLRKIAVAAASKPAVEIRQDGESFYIKTSTTVRTTEISFTVGQDFTEQTVDGRPCLSSPCWDTDSRIRCVQTLLKGEGPHTSWTREITNDGELILVRGRLRRGRGSRISVARTGTSVTLISFP
ncbi:RABP2 protein, partial [Polyodon spathula]|nr:RABP2 protein [Polyodon spathula]